MVVVDIGCGRLLIRCIEHRAHIPGDSGVWVLKRVIRRPKLMDLSLVSKWESYVVIERLIYFIRIIP
jgi:hypothetical protein